jgi:hypothetical protein
MLYSGGGHIEAIPLDRSVQLTWKHNNTLSLLDSLQSKYDIRNAAGTMI